MRSVDELFAVVVEAQDDDERWSAIRALRANGSGQEVFERALRLSASTSAQERIAGADVLGQFAETSPRAVDALIAMLDDAAVEVVEAVVHALSQTHDQRTITALERLSKHDVPNVRWAVATALEDLIAVDERAERILLSLMRDDEASVRDRATFAVGSLSDHDTPRLRAALAERLHDSDTAVASEAALGLARRRDSRAIPFITDAMRTGEIDVEEAADEITSPDMLPELVKARANFSEVAEIDRLIARCREKE